MGNRKVIILDDNKLVCDSLAKTLPWERMGCVLAGTAYNGKDGWELAQRTLPDLVVSDIRMPLMDGLELSANIKEHNPQTHIIIITGFDEFEYARKALRIGVHDILLKPISNEELEASVRRAFAKTAASGLEDGMDCSPLCSGAILFLEGNIKEKPDLGTTADQFRVSGAHLSRVLKKETGFSFIELFNRIRMRRAVVLLKEGRLKGYEVAEQVGIADYAYFCETFKRITGKTPREISMEDELPELFCRTVRNGQ